MQSFTSIQLLIACGIALVSCSEKKESKPEDSANKPHSEKTSTSARNTDARNEAAKARTEKEKKLEQKEFYMKFANEVQSHSDPIALLESRWSSMWHPSFDEPWTSPDNKSLSQLLIDINSGIEPGIGDTLHEKKEPLATDPQLRKSAMMISLAFVAAFSTPTDDEIEPTVHLPRLLSKYCNLMPPTTGDVITCKSIMEATASIEGRPRIPSGVAANWNEFAKAKNPLYRLMALKVFRKFEVTQEEAETFYSAYFDEQEVGINKALVTALSTRSDAWSLEAIAKVKAKIQPSPK